jgi:hypothetical protein
MTDTRDHVFFPADVADIRRGEVTGTRLRRVERAVRLVANVLGFLFSQYLFVKFFKDLKGCTTHGSHVVVHLRFPFSSCEIRGGFRACTFCGYPCATYRTEGRAY